MQMSPINIAKDYLANNEQYSHMLDGDFSVTAHDPSLDSHMVNQLDGVEHSDISDWLSLWTFFSKSSSISFNSSINLCAS